MIQGAVYEDKNHAHRIRQVLLLTRSRDFITDRPLIFYRKIRFGIINDMEQIMSGPLFTDFKMKPGIEVGQRYKARDYFAYGCGADQPKWLKDEIRGGNPDFLIVRGYGKKDVKIRYEKFGPVWQYSHKEMGYPDTVHVMDTVTVSFESKPNQTYEVPIVGFHALFFKTRNRKDITTIRIGDIYLLKGPTKASGYYTVLSYDRRADNVRLQNSMSSEILNMDKKSIQDNFMFMVKGEELKV